MTDPDLDEPTYAAFAWARFRRILAWMGVVSAGVAALAVLTLWLSLDALPLTLAIGAALGIGGSVFLTAVLMGLVFLSSGTGHDAAVDRRPDREAPDTRD